MASKKVVLDLGTEVKKLSQNIERLTSGLDTFSSKVEQLNGVLSMVQRKVQGVEEFLGRVIFPSEELHALTGELRAFRSLWDKEGQFKFMDKPQMTKVGGEPNGGSST